MRTLHLASTVIVYFKSPRDVSSLQVLNRQLYPEKKGFLLSSYRHATRVPHNPLVIQLANTADERTRVSSNFFASGQEAVAAAPIVYMPAN